MLYPFPFEEPKIVINIPFDLLPEAKLWGIGHTYRVEIRVKQIGMNETGATFELQDAASMNWKDKFKRSFMSGNTYHE